MRRELTCFAATAAVVAVVGIPSPAGAQARVDAGPPLLPLFSSLKAGGPFPAAWGPVKIAAGKKPTQYALVDDGGTVVLNAKAEAAATGLGSDVRFDVNAAPVLEWRWKIAGLIAGADNSVGSKEDSPARIVLYFDGDRAKLPLGDRTKLALADGLQGKQVPYATLMYIWAGTAPVGTIVINPNTGRVRMVVASSGAGGAGKWQSLRRNIAEDFRRAFGEDPGLLIGVGVLTDTDNTGGSAEAWYGDIRFLPAS
jgi:hypothetical protein